VAEMVVIEEHDYGYDREGNAYQVKEPKIHTQEKIQLWFDHVYVLSREAFL
jgi:hypothetical protein